MLESVLHFDAPKAPDECRQMTREQLDMVVIIIIIIIILLLLLLLLLLYSTQSQKVSRE